ncbi:MAG: kynureninase [Vicinamibacterales bacterium]
MPVPTSRGACEALDARDPLRSLRARFSLPDDVVYLDGNSLGARPVEALDRVSRVVASEWGRDLIRAWNTAGWIDLPRVVGDKIARLVGAGPGEVAVADSTSVNLFKALHAAASVTPAARTRLVTERRNFPTDVYIAGTVAEALGWELVLVDDREAVTGALDDRTAVLLLTHVDYRTGAMHDMAAVTHAAHEHGALVVWDLAHSAGAMPVDLKGADADLAVGCGYKFLNGGPGAPAFLWAHPRLGDAVRQPLTGWMGHRTPFDFDWRYVPAEGARRFLCGTPPVLSLAALECGVDSLLAAEPLGGLAALREKSVALADVFIALVEARCAGHGLTIASPRDARRRGSHVSLTRTEGGYAIVQALIARGVIGDFRPGDESAPDILRFGFAPAYVRYVDVWDAVDHLAAVLAGGEWRDPALAVRKAVT